MPYGFNAVLITEIVHEAHQIDRHNLRILSNSQKKYRSTWLIDTATNIKYSSIRVFNKNTVYNALKIA